MPTPLRVFIGWLVRLLKLLLGSVTSVVSDAHRVALTFDDGPDSRDTQAILRVLRAHGAKATFFVLSERVEHHPEVARMVRDQGHEIALHGANHDRLTTLGIREVIDRIMGGKRRLRRSLGRDAELFRPAYGSQDLRSYLVARLAGLKVIVWSADPHDWTDEAASEVVARALDRIRPGGILLLHDAPLFGPDHERSRPAYDRAEMVANVLDGLRGRGLQAVTVSELLATGRPRRDLWFES